MTEADKKHVERLMKNLETPYKERAGSVGGIFTNAERMKVERNKYPYACYTLPKWAEGADHVKDGKKRGQPIIRSQSHEKELCRRYGYAPSRDVYLAGD